MGRAMLKFMNLCHAPLTNWGLKHIDIQDGWTMLDIGCGGGATLQRLLIPQTLSNRVGEQALSLYLLCETVTCPCCPASLSHR
jgi:hypothetical protein